MHHKGVGIMVALIMLAFGFSPVFSSLLFFTYYTIFIKSVFVVELRVNLLMKAL